MNEQNKKNIIFHQVQLGKNVFFKEIKPPVPPVPQRNSLVLTENRDLMWASYVGEVRAGRGISVSNVNGIVTIDVDASVDAEVFENERIKGTNLYCYEDRLGIGRKPLYTYKFDIAVPKDTIVTAFHVGDGSYGFSMGNATNVGFLPEIIGMGEYEDDAGLYLLGRAGNNHPSSIPLVVIDGRSNSNKPLRNRPIFGVTSGTYDEYKFLVNERGNVGIGKVPKIYRLEVEGTVGARDFVMDSSISMKELINVVLEQNKEINLLKKKLDKLTLKRKSRFHE